MRKLQPDGICGCCGKVGAVFATVCQPMDFGNGLILETDTSLPDLCMGCNDAQHRWDARQHQLRTPTAGYPFAEKPPRTPPVRRPGDADLGPDGWPDCGLVACEAVPRE